MTTKPAVLLQTQAVPASETAIVQSAVGTLTIITKLTSYNTSGTAVTITAKVVPSGATLAATHTLASKTLLAGETYGWPELVGRMLNPGDLISFLPSATGTNVRAEGTQTAV